MDNVKMMLKDIFIMRRCPSLTAGRRTTRAVILIENDLR